MLAIRRILLLVILYVKIGGGGVGHLTLLPSSSGNLGSPISGSGVYQQNTVEQHMAEAAMVTDGYRQPSGPEFQSLPPYTPGPSRQFMDGHGNESNEMRLSEYVKGQTRAQNMKGAGGGM